jgi:hypothetical protein
MAVEIPEDGSSMTFRNVGTLPQHTTLKTTTRVFIAMKTSNLTQHIQVNTLLMELHSRYGQGFLHSPPRPDRLWGPLSLLSNGYLGILSWEKSGRDLMLTTHVRLVPKLRMRGSVHSLPPYILTV